MTEGDSAPETSLPVVPPVSSLQGVALANKAQIESMIGDPNSAYWKGETAGVLQAGYRDLLRAEQLGAPMAIGPAGDVDDDMPATIEGYGLHAAAGARSMNAEDRGIIDEFLPVAFAAGLGKRKVLAAIGWALTIEGLTIEQFKDLAVAANWSNRAIDACLQWYLAEAARRGQAPRTG